MTAPSSATIPEVCMYMIILPRTVTCEKSASSLANTEGFDRLTGPLGKTV